ncbi:response regulator [Xanthobacter albus]|uniref:response regulator n=1 Tax=Xanthobacter albus TaxID=3119929 RepID=UPI00372D25C2
MKPLLLLVEDDPVEARRLESAVHLLGYDAALARDGDEALALMERMAFDVVLLDLVLPELDGMGVLGAMKARGIRVPVVAAVTAEGIDTAASAIRAGARDFVVKPAGALRLQVALANAMALANVPAAGTPMPKKASPERAEALAGEARITPVEAGSGRRPVLHLVGERPEAPPACDPPAAPAPWVDRGGHVRPLEEIEEKAIRFACAHYDGRLTEVARRLGIGRSTLYRKLSRLGLAAYDGTRPPPNMEPIAALFVAAE